MDICVCDDCKMIFDAEERFPTHRYEGAVRIDIPEPDASEKYQCPHCESHAVEGIDAAHIVAGYNKQFKGKTVKGWCRECLIMVSEDKLNHVDRCPECGEKCSLEYSEVDE